MMEEKEFELKIEEAKKRVKNFDKIDKFEDRYLSTILSALKCGLKRPETDSQYDAYFMLEDLILKKGEKLK